jgi:hypothetical protein
MGVIGMPCTWDDLRPYADWLRQPTAGLHRNILSARVIPYGRNQSFWQGVINSYFPAFFLPVPNNSLLSKLRPRIEGEFSGEVFSATQGAAIYIGIWNDNPAVHVRVDFPDRSVMVAPVDCAPGNEEGTGIFLSGNGDDGETYGVSLLMSTVVEIPSTHVGTFHP